MGEQDSEEAVSHHRRWNMRADKYTISSKPDASERTGFAFVSSKALRPLPCFNDVLGRCRIDQTVKWHLKCTSSWIRHNCAKTKPQEERHNHNLGRL